MRSLPPPTTIAATSVSVVSRLSSAVAKSTISIGEPDRVAIYGERGGNRAAAIGTVAQHDLCLHRQHFPRIVAEGDRFAAGHAGGVDDPYEHLLSPRSLARDPSLRLFDLFAQRLPQA